MVAQFKHRKRNLQAVDFQTTWPCYPRGTSIAELLVALAILATAMVGVGQFASNTGSGLSQRELSTRIGWELANAREQIGSWQPENINVQQIESLPFSESLNNNLDDLRWRAKVETLTEPARAIRVALTLHCTLHGQPAQPASLVFWVATESPKTEPQEAREL